MCIGFFNSKRCYKLPDSLQLSLSQGTAPCKAMLLLCGQAALNHPLGTGMTGSHFNARL